MRGQLDNEGSFVPYCDPAVLPTFLADINETVAWLYEAAGEQASLDEYEQRMYRFKDVGEKIRTKVRFHEALPQTKANYDALMRKVEAKLASEDEVSVAKREQIIAICSATSEFWEKFQTAVTTQPKWEDPAFTIIQAEDMFRMLAMIA
jgi:hypothetical protein